MERAEQKSRERAALRAGFVGEAAPSREELGQQLLGQGQHSRAPGSWTLWTVR